MLLSLVPVLATVTVHDEGGCKKSFTTGAADLEFEQLVRRVCNVLHSLAALVGGNRLPSFRMSTEGLQVSGGWPLIDFLVDGCLVLDFPSATPSVPFRMIFGGNTALSSRKSDSPYSDCLVELLKTCSETVKK
jgi:hypothetical protein